MSRSVAVGLALLVAAVLGMAAPPFTAGPPAPAPAALALPLRAPTDGPGDDLDCADFDGNGGFQAAQDNLVATWPDDPNGLDANTNGIACENYNAFAAAAADADPAWVTLGLPAPGRDGTRTATPAPTAAATVTATPAPTAPPTPTPTFAPQPTPVPAAPIAPTVPPSRSRSNPTPEPTRVPPVSYRDALPKDLLDRVDQCAAVSVSRRRLAASGCLDGRIVLWKQPRDEPDLKRTAVVRFINPLDRVAPAPSRPARGTATPTPTPESGNGKKRSR